MGLIDYKRMSVIETPTGAGAVAVKDNTVRSADVLELLEKQYHIENNFETKDFEILAQLHCHSNDGTDDGADTPTVLETAYKDAGFGYIAITGHNKLTTDPAVAGIFHGEGAEESGWFGHLGAVGINTTTQAGNPQGIIDSVHSEGGFATISHIDLASEPWALETVYATKGFDAIEVYNAHVNENYETTIDALLTLGLRFFLVAADDCHNVTTLTAAGRFGSGVYVNTDTNSAAGVEAALLDGNFYASQGPTITLTLDLGILTVTTPGAATIAFIKTGGVTAQTTAAATTASYTIQGEEQYIRVRITRDSDSKIAWSNPYWIDRLDDGLGSGSSPIRNRLRAEGDFADATLVYHGEFYDSTARDSGIFSNDGTLEGAVTAVDGVLNFTGAASDAVTFPNRLVDYQDSFTITAWIYPRATGSNRQIVSSGANGQFLIGAGGAVRFRSEGVNTNIAGTVNDEEWTHLALTYDGTNIRIYVNGVVDVTAARTLAASDQNTSLGEFFNNSERFKGGMMDVRLYHRASPVSEILRIMRHIPRIAVGGYLLLKRTDTDSDVEATLWYDESENKLKYFNGSTVKILAEA